MHSWWLKRNGNGLVEDIFFALENISSFNQTISIEKLCLSLDDIYCFSELSACSIDFCQSKIYRFTLNLTCLSDTITPPSNILDENVGVLSLTNNRKF